MMHSSPVQVKPKTIKFVFVASLLKIQHYRVRGDWLGIRIICPEWSDMSTHSLLFQSASSIKIQLSVLVLSLLHHCFKNIP